MVEAVQWVEVGTVPRAPKYKRTNVGRNEITVVPGGTVEGHNPSAVGKSSTGLSGGS